MMRQIKKKLWVNICSLSFLIGIVWLVIAGCALQDERISPELLFTATPSNISTSTVVWFPATATPTPHPNPTVTPNLAATPSFGKLIFNDSFAGDGVWQNSQQSNGLIIVKGGTLTLAVKSARESLSTFRSDTTLTSYYLETTVNVGLCKQDDQIGVLFRVSGSQSYYRLLLNCQGMVALQEVIGGAPFVLSDWTPSNVQAGLYRVIKIGIWQSGSSIRIYLDDQLQLEATSDRFKSGGIGFYARATGDTPLTVSFTSLNVFQIVQTSVNTPTLQLSN